MAATVLVTGATGFVGRHLVAPLQAAGYRVRAALRASAPLPAAVEAVVVGDLGETIDWGRALDGVDCIVHLAGLAHARGLPDAQYDRINHHATTALALAASQRGVRRLVFVSSVLAQTASTDADLVTEDRAPAPSGAYGASKLAAERALQALPIESVCLRPPLIYGAGVRANMARLADLARLPLPLPFAGVHNQRSLLAIDNLASAIVHCLVEPRAAGETFLVADDTPLSLPAMIAALRAGLDRKPRLFAVRPDWLRAAARLAGAGSLWERLAGDLVVSNQKLRSIGWAPAIDSASGLAAMAAGPGR